MDTARYVAEFHQATKGIGRHQVIDLAHNLIQSLETPADILQRIGYSVRCLQTNPLHKLTKQPCSIFRLPSPTWPSTSRYLSS